MKYKKLAELLKNATETDAYGLYGWSNVDRWFREGLISTQQSTDTSQIFLDRSELNPLTDSRILITYLPTMDR